MNNKQNKEDIIQRLKQHYGFTTNAELANKLGVAPNTISGWIKRNSIDYDLVFSKCEDLDLNWLMSGKTATHEIYRESKQPQIAPPSITISEKFDLLQILKEHEAELYINKYLHQFHELKTYPLFDIQEKIDLINTVVESYALPTVIREIYKQYKTNQDSNLLNEKFIEAYKRNKELYLIFAPYAQAIDDLYGKLANFIGKYEFNDILLKCEDEDL